MKVQLLELTEALLKFSINFSKPNTKILFEFALYADNSYLFVNKKEIFKFEADNKNVNFPIQFCLGSLSNEFIV